MASRVAGAAPGESRTADRNEFADAVARMFEHRQQVAPDFAPALRDDAPVRDEPDELEAPRVSLLSTLIGASALRRALSIVPLAILGYVIAWFLYFEPSQRVTTKPVVDILQEASRAAAAIELPAPRPEVAEAKSAPPPAPAPPPVAPAAAPVTVAAVPPSRPLSKDEIKELQGKLSAAGFTAGPIDGVVGPQTQAALRRYAQARSLANPDATQETLLKLRSETQASQ
jgi:putative peptidoglycan binding protein